MEVIKVQKKNNVNLQLDCNRGIAMELNEFFSFLVEGYRFMPAYKNKQWDGKVRLFNRNTYELPVGLYQYLAAFAKDRGYEVDTLDGPLGLPDAKEDVSPEMLFNFIKGLNLHGRGNPIEIRDYQFNAVLQAARDKRSILLSPTGSGKSLIIYSLMRWYLEGGTDQKILIIVPTTSLVEQMKADFCDYSSHDDSWSAEDDCHTIFSGKEKVFSQRVVISTWQSIFRLQAKWFHQFGAVFGDEVHGFKSKSLSGIMNKAIYADYRYGTTGTLDGTQTHKLVLEGLFGKLMDVTTTKKLQDDNTLAALDISIMMLKHSDKTRQEFGKKTYQEEIDYIVRSEARNRFIRNLALKLDGNTLVLYNFVEKHGKPLFKDIKEKAGDDRKVFFVSGDVDTADREAIRHIVEKQNNSIIVASLGTFSTGINIRNLHNIVFASPSKSQIRVLQSIGRGLRKSDNGVTTQLYDITDNISHGSIKNFALLHGFERVKMYKKQEFNFRIFDINIKEKHE